jgi:toxin HigB-1
LSEAKSGAASPSTPDFAAAQSGLRLLFPGWKLHPLKGGRRGEWSVWVSGNYRITFRVDGENVTDIDFEDYHGK